MVKCTLTVEKVTVTHGCNYFIAIYLMFRFFVMEKVLLTNYCVDVKHLSV